jgi:DNA-binding NarL/FixJ family response regulator
VTAIRILLADDHEVVRRGLRTLLEGQPGWEVCAQAADGREAVGKTKLLKPDIVVMDISMPVLNGLEATRQILKINSHTRVLILTMHESDQIVREVLDAGARGYILKSDAGHDLVAAVGALRRRNSFFTSKVADRVLDGYRGVRAKDDGSSCGRLTPREREVLQLLAEGKSSKEVAVTLDVSVRTAETHRANIARKLDLHSISDLVRYAVRNNIIEP